MKSTIDTSDSDEIIKGRVDPYIYAFSTNEIPNHLKVGDTYRPLSVRLDEWRAHYKNLSLEYKHVAKVDNGMIFRDYSVHRFLEHDRNLKRLERGLYKLLYYSNEFFKDATNKDLDDAIEDIQRSSVENDGKYRFYSQVNLPEHFSYQRQEEWKLRPNQKEVVDNFVNAINNGRNHLLMYAVMRFGKSFTAMCCACAINARFVVVLSAKADVNLEWKMTVEKPANFEGYYFLDSESLKNDSEMISKYLSDNKNVVLFLTLQDLQGDNIKEKHKDVFKNTIDLLIVDETHYGARGEEYGKILRNCNLRKNEIENELGEYDNFSRIEDIKKIKSLNARIQLHLSGTPYRILMNDSEFSQDDIIAFCQFSDIYNEQKKWDEEHLEGAKEWNNPYYGFPQMIRFAFTPNESSRKLLEKLKDNNTTYAFSELFRPKSIIKDRNGNFKKFKYENEVRDFLKVIDGTKNDDQLMGFLDYDKIKEGKMCRHIVCVLPYRASCDSMEELISSMRRSFRNLDGYEIINIAGLISNYDTTDSVKNKIKKCEAEGKKTLSLTVNKMLTGCTVEQWDTMLFMKDTASPQEYDQSIFRIQNQYIKTYSDENGDIIKYNMKPQTLLVDFDPNRVFRLQEQKSLIYNANKEKNGNLMLKERMEEELKISPIFVLNSNKMRKVTPSDIIDVIREYSKSKSVLDEAVEIPIDAFLLENSYVKAEIENINGIDSKKGIFAEPTKKNGNGDDIETQESDSTPGQEDKQKSDEEKVQPSSTEDEMKSLEKKMAAYYSKILFFAFLSTTELMSLQQIIEYVSTRDNERRIADNLGLNLNVLKLLQSKCHPNILSILDRKIQNINSLMRDTSMTPLERAKVAVKKFTRLSDSEIITPDYLANELVAFLPSEKITNETIFFDFASKQGEMAVAIYEKYQNIGSIKNNIYSLPTSKLSYELTRKMYEMLGMPVDNVISDFESSDFISGNEELENKIKSLRPHIIIGAPPFNSNDGGGRGNSASAMYHEYFQVAKRYSPQYISIYMKAVWYSGGKGKGLRKFRKDMLDDNRISIFSDYPNPKDCHLEGVNLRGGVCAFLWDADHEGKCLFTCHLNNSIWKKKRLLKTPDEDILIRFSIGQKIINRVKCLCDQNLGEFVSSRDPFGLHDTFTDYKNEPDREYNTHIYDVKKKDGYMKSSLLENKHFKLKNQWKVLVAKASPGDDSYPQKIFSDPVLSEPGSVCTNGLLVVKTFDSKSEAENMIKYMQTQFFRFMMLLAKSGHNMTKDTFMYVPALDMSKSWDDKKLYKMFNVTSKEIEFIDKVVKEWSSNGHKVL